MTNLTQVSELNPHLTIVDVRDQRFEPYGKVLEDFPFKKVAHYMTETVIPPERNTYSPVYQPLDNDEIRWFIENKYYGGMSIQMGFCNGTNSRLGGLEFHKGSEINVAVTDLILLLGDVRDITEGGYYSGNVKAFFVPAGTSIEIYQTTLHLAPCKVNEEGFKCVVILPRGTNMPISHEVKKEDLFLFMKNKWLLAHPDHQRFVNQGAHIGIKGPNTFVQYIKK
ncbi:DUF4867 family protein [Thalassobacillus pellis]|uniref:DUF4867 family protein n=1 Tax=Thalassobacillus pellis TaxID=748008 RepID=UPI00196187C6|nr:DUF4867 family protein [Thalassobacillus pellis]MBM7554453.1 hypothetical protein [Thalassobacillus pellis]